MQRSGSLRGSGAWLAERDLRVVLVCNRGASRATIAVLRAASKLGDGLLWVALVPILAAAVDGPAALRWAGALATAGLTYRLAKQWTGRERPHVACAEIELLEAPLDRYSFPSGHTLHAVAAAVVVSDTVPGAGWLLWPFAALVAASRIVLGLHYPSDVVAGAAVGLAIGLAWT
ncbi:MAG: phosphatase PAP2 family protein [Myxococcota bacterium]